MKESKTTNTLLLIIVIPLIFYLLKTLSFIFIPLIASMLIALLFLPLTRWMNKKKIPKPIGILMIILIILGILKSGGILIQLSMNEIISADGIFIEKAESKLVSLVESIEGFFGIERLKDENILFHYFKNKNIFENFSSTLDYIGDTISMTLMTTFFVILLLTESINFQKVLNATMLKQTYASIKTFRKIEKDIIMFAWVKVLISLFTGVGFGLACWFFGVSFPIFWGLFAFLVNFVQMIGSVVSVILLSLFAFIEIEPMSTLFIFVLTIIAVQVIMGGVLEPIFMGKTFSINVITVIIMLMLWGYIWGVSGLIMSIPITVIAKIILDQFPGAKVVSSLMSGSTSNRKEHVKKSTY
jgi:predicted PurR-regulated permease PerM